MKAAYRLQAICENWEGAGSDLPAALTQNRKLWTILATSATEPDNPLPAALKSNVAQIAAIIFQRTLTVLAEPAPEKITLLININREIAAGLRGIPQAA